MSETDDSIKWEDDNVTLDNQESLKDMLVAEIDTIRDAMVVINMFLGEPLKASLNIINEFSDNEKPS